MKFELYFTETVNSWGEVVYTPTALGYTALIGLCLVFLLGGLFLIGRQLSGRKLTRQLVFSASAMALSLVLSELRLFRMPMGGSVTPCSMLFLVLIGYWYGPAAGILTGFSHGILQLLLDPMIYSLPQLLVDYPLAFGALGLSGCFCLKRNGIFWGSVLGIAGRCCFAILSGALFFASYAPEAMNVWWYSFLYNGGYIGTELLITLIIVSLPPVKKALASVTALATEGGQRA